MREIKFRAWNKNKNKMVHPTGVYGNMKFWHIESGNSGYWGIFGSGSKRICGNADDSGILMQYTGLKDKNGVEIYEGDILDTDLERPYVIVEFRNGCFVYNCFDDGKSYYDIMHHLEDEISSTKYHKVIGNIYENPELLEVGV